MRAAVAKTLRAAVAVPFKSQPIKTPCDLLNSYARAPLKSLSPCMPKSGNLLQSAARTERKISVSTASQPTCVTTTRISARFSTCPKPSNQNHMASIQRIETAVDNLINGNLTQARKSARGLTYSEIFDWLSGSVGWTEIRSRACADYLIGRIDFRTYCKSDR